jgi:hypothetical protein
MKVLPLPTRRAMLHERAAMFELGESSLKPLAITVLSRDTEVIFREPVGVVHFESRFYQANRDGWRLCLATDRNFRTCSEAIRLTPGV